VDLNIAAIQAHGVAMYSLIKALKKSVPDNDKDQSEHNGDGGDGRAARVAPDVSPGHFGELTH
jgi:hypothetical protein